MLLMEKIFLCFFFLNNRTDLHTLSFKENWWIEKLLVSHLHQFSIYFSVYKLVTNIENVNDKY